MAFSLLLGSTKQASFVPGSASDMPPLPHLPIHCKSYVVDCMGKGSRARAQ